MTLTDVNQNITIDKMHYNVLYKILLASCENQ